MQDSDWYEIKFLESAANLKGLIKKSLDKVPSTKIATQIGVCIQQGRLFFEAASSAPLQIKPLQIYYGVLAFSRAVVLARKLVPIDTLTASHGLTDVSAHNANIENLAVKIGNRGTFQELNDAVAPLGRIWYFEDSMPKWISNPFSNAESLRGHRIGITDIFSRIPDISRTFERTFGSSPKAWPISLYFHPITTGQCDLRVDDPNLFTDKESLIFLVQKWRREYPFLNQWCFSEASLAWGYSVLIFRNIKKGTLNDLAIETLVQGNNGFSTTHTLMGSQFEWITAFDILPPLSGGITNVAPYAIQPLGSVYLSEFSLQFLASYLLSSLVRYRPQIWQHAISRSFTAETPADDKALAMVEQFLAGVLNDFPKLVVRATDYLRVH
jgi:hypothetical protein